jgi:hypothetical protein
MKSLMLREIDSCLFHDKTQWRRKDGGRFENESSFC